MQVRLSRSQPFTLLVEVIMRMLAGFVAALGLLAAAGCGPTVKAGSFVDHAVDFHRYHSYNWGARAAEPAGNPRLDKNAELHDRLQGELEKALAAKGFRGPAGRKSDLIVRYRVAVTPRVRVGGVESGYGYCSMDCSKRVEEYEAATIIVDVIDSRTEKVIWRGWARDKLDDVLDNPGRMAERLHTAVERMMSTLPSNA